MDRECAFTVPGDVAVDKETSARRGITEQQDSQVAIAGDVAPAQLKGALVLCRHSAPVIFRYGAVHGCCICV